uniref:Uncharacterized protein n=1 Tax=Medicago truncatula TaxID=3880 RepID=B7FFU5_MEDTR|nr:unknown [Medicago truncatula]
MNYYWHYICKLFCHDSFSYVFHSSPSVSIVCINLGNLLF